MTSRPSCFISYTHDNADFDTIAAFEEALVESAKGSIDIFVDNRLAVGDRLSDHEALITNVSGAIILLTPEYFKKVSERNGGVYREYKRIIDRLAQAEQRRRANRRSGRGRSSPDTFMVFPILFAGTLEESCPEELRQHVVGHFVQFRAQRNQRNKVFVSDHAKAKHAPLLKQVVDRLHFGHVSASDSFQGTYESLFNKLFLETKHELIDGLLTEDTKFEIYVKTRAFRQVRNQSAYILVGRKGSGKTTITKQLALEHSDDYFPPVEIYVDGFDLEFLFEFTLDKRIYSELRTLQPQVRLLRTAWKLFICVAAIASVARSADLRLPPKVKAVLDQALPESNNSGEINYWSIFVWAFTKSIAYVDIAIERARTTRAEFFADIARQLDESEMFLSLLPLKSLRDVERILSPAGKRILFTLDGFDTNFAGFRTTTVHNFGQTDQEKTRNQLEFDWLRALLHVAIEFKSNRQKLPLVGMIDFCLTIPKDRFLEIQNLERDAVVYRNKLSNILWSGYELFLMMRKRLESLSNYRTAEGKELVERLHEVMHSKFGEIPRVLEIEFHGEIIRIETIIYILRHTFWRPRDVLYYVGKLIAYRDELKKWRRTLTSDLIRKAISDCTWDVIRSEFLNEFQSYCPNIEAIVGTFRKCDQVLTYEQVYEAIGSLPFSFANKVEGVTEIYPKISFLFEVGFLGIELEDDIVKSHRVLTNLIFSFSDGESIFKSITQDQLSRQKFVIHPIFCEWLSLRTEGQSMVLQYKWNYLRLNDDVLAVA